MDIKKNTGSSNGIPPLTCHSNASKSSMGMGSARRSTSTDRTSAEKLPPQQPPPTSATNSGNKTSGGGGGHIRRGGLSRYLLEKVQCNDSGLDVSPATLQTLVQPMRSSTSSSSLHVRTLFESPSSSSKETTPSPSIFTNVESAPVPQQHEIGSVLSEQSHNSSETTVIEKTVTEDTTSKGVSYTKNSTLDSFHKIRDIKDKEIIYHRPVNHQQRGNSIHNITPKGHLFSVPCSIYDRAAVNAQSGATADENVEPLSASQGISSSYNSSQKNHFNSITTANVAAVIQHQAKVQYSQTPKPKTTKKKVPSSEKKSAGWKFLSEHVQQNEFLIIKHLGKGGCGEVSLVIEKDTRKLFALKIVKLHGINDAHVQECINEVEMLTDLKGTDLVVEIQSWEFNRVEKTMKIVMELGQCDLNYTILKSKSLSLLKMKAIWERLLLIVDQIHSKGIVHADLKPSNFIWVGDNLKIIDFGIASRLQSDLTSIAMCNPKGTLNFISPEILKLDDAGRSKLSPKSDIWALGCMLYLMVYSCTPFEHITHSVTKMNAILQGEIMYPALPSHLHSSGSLIVSVLKECFQPDYKRRPSAAELLQHPFLRC